MIQIGDKAFQTRRPQDLDAKLIAATGCDATEAQRWLQGSPSPASVASAIAPWLIGDSAPDLATLGVMIADAGVADVASQVATLYAAVPTRDAAE